MMSTLFNVLKYILWPRTWSIFISKIIQLSSFLLMSVCLLYLSPSFHLKFICLYIQGGFLVDSTQLFLISSHSLFQLVYFFLYSILFIPSLVLIEHFTLFHFLFCLSILIIFKNQGLSQGLQYKFTTNPSLISNNTILFHRQCMYITVEQSQFLLLSLITQLSFISLIHKPQSLNKLLLLLL